MKDLSPAVVLAGFEDVADAVFVDQHVGLAAATDLEAVSVVPLDRSVHFLAVLEDNDHGRARLHLLLEVEGFRMRLLCSVAALGHALLGAGERLAVTRIGAMRCAERWPNQLSVYELICFDRGLRRTANCCGIA